jgi:mannitol/fructose-specific phosphotransferase system IIA component (Ntr-type)
MNADLISRAVILEALPATNKDEALSAVLTSAVEAGLVAKRETPALMERLRARERLGSTGIGNGVAIPHVKSDGVAQLGLVLARSVSGLDYDAIDGRPVHTLFLLLAPTQQSQEHLAALKWISTLARDTDFRRFFLAAPSAAAIRELLLEMSGRK